MLLKTSQWSLRTKIIAWSFVPTTIIMLAVALVTFYAYQRVTEDLVVGRNREVTRLSASQLAADLGEYTNLLGTLARTGEISGGDPAAQRIALASARNRLVIFDSGVVILNSHGTVVAAEPGRPDALDRSWSDRSYFRQMLRSSAPVFSDIVADGPSGSEVIVVAVPITGPQNEFRGVMAGMFYLGARSVSAFYGGIVKLRMKDGGSTSVVDSGGRVIYQANPDLIGRDLSSRELVQQVLKRNVGELRTRDPDGRDIVASYAPVPGTPWGLLTEESWESLMASSQPYRQFLMVLLTLGVVVPSLVVTIGVRRITGPIAKLIRASQEVAAGNFGRTISVQTGDELEELARQFNLMSAELQESYAGLERKVAHRTRELATLNSIAAVVSRSLDLEEILENSLEKTLEAMEIEVGGVYLLDRRGEVLHLVAYRGFDSRFAAMVDDLKVGEGFSGRVVQRGEPVVVTDILADPWLTRLAASKLGHVPLASVPLSSRGEVLGALFVAGGPGREFAAQEIQLLVSIGNQIGVAVENGRLFAAEQRRAEQFQVIGETGHRITSILAADELLKEIVHLVKTNLGYYDVSIGLIEGDELVFKSGAGSWWEAPGHTGPRLQVGGEGLCAWVAKSGEPLLVSDVSREPRYIPVAGMGEIRSELVVPVRTQKAVIGVLDVQSDRLNAFDESDLAVLQSLAHQAAVAIENARLYEQAQQLAVMEERNRLARDLHDSVTQAVYGVTLYAEAAARLLSAGQVEVATEHLRELRSTAQQALREMRSLIFELRPPVLEKEGLVAALQARLEAVEGRAGVATEFKVSGEGRLSAEAEGTLYRIAQEALNNALKHARACGIRLSLSLAGEGAVLEIADDGVGFDLEAAREHAGLGLRGMAERVEKIGGCLTVTSRPGEGTTIRVAVGPASG